MDEKTYNWQITGFRAIKQLKENFEIIKSIYVSSSLMENFPEGLNKVEISNRYFEIYKGYFNLGGPAIILTDASELEIVEKSKEISKNFPKIKVQETKPGPIPEEIKELIREAKRLFNSGLYFEAYDIENEVKKAGYGAYLLFSEKDDPEFFSYKEN